MLRVLISGAGIAGPTLAYWLAHHGAEPTLVEKAPQLRTGGYIVDFWGAGFDVAGRMGLLPEIRNRGYTVGEVKVVNARGERIAGFPSAALTRTTGAGFTSLPRGDLAAAIFSTVAGKAETIFGDSVRRIEQTTCGVRVEFEHSRARSFDLVIGADGLHSRIREIVFGPSHLYERYLGIKAAAFAVKGYRPRDELTYVMYSEVGQQVSRFSMRDDHTMFLFTFADDDPSLPADDSGQKAALRRRFGKSGWECRQIVDALDAVPDLYFDRVSQIDMQSAVGGWTRGRVALVGDSAFCVSLLGGQGSALAMTAAYMLAGELHRASADYRQGFSRYQAVFGPFVSGKQRAARRFAGAFAPRSRLALYLRNRIFQLMSVSWIANLIAGRGISDHIALPEY